VALASHEHALVLFDRAGRGKEGVGRAALEREVEERLAASGWSARAAAIVMDPELEAWVWVDSPHVERIVGWAGARGGLRGWLESESQSMTDRARLCSAAALSAHLVSSPARSGVSASA
jgi:hypothetical protein